MTTRLLVVSQYWAPAELAGGARSTGRAVAAVADRVETWVVAGDRDVGDPGPWTDVPVPLPGSGGWVDCDGVHVRYQRWDLRSGRRVRAAIDEVDPDVIYLPSLFAPGSLAVLWRRWIRGVTRPVVVAPEGELHPGALAHHHGRKRAVLVLLRRSGLGRSVRWRAVDATEARQIRRIAGPRAAIHVAPDLHDAPRDPPPPSAPKAPGRARAAFVGSIVPKKGLHRALELLWPLRHDIDLDVYGPIVDEEEWARCRAVLDRGVPDGAWQVHGAIPHDQVGPALAAADLLVLPTLGENYGYVIAEALAAGCPVLTSDQTPWRDLADDGCGWDLPLDDVAGWRTALAEVVGWDDDDRRRARHAALERARRARDGADDAREAWHRLFAGAASQGAAAPGSTMRR
jgi:glycosyltransferase involved in cell wall biosynthesis